MLTDSPVCGTTSTVRTPSMPGMSSAASTLAFSATPRPARRPPSAVMMAQAPQLRTRSAMDAGANPPNTTLCTAPMRAHASSATTVSAIIGI
ncbi:hypothetical protein D3C71_968220 [compost metagenome]